METDDKSRFFGYDPPMSNSPDLSPRGRGQFLKNLADFQTELFRVMGGFIPGVEDWIMRREISQFVFRDARRVQDLRTRFRELGVSFNEMHLSAGIAGRELIEALCEAPTTADFLFGVFKTVKPILADALEKYLKTMEGVYDRPTQPILQANLEEISSQVAWAERSLAALGDKKPDKAFRKKIQELAAKLPALLEKPDAKGVSPVLKGRRIGRLPILTSAIPEDFNFVKMGIGPLKEPSEYRDRERWHALNFLQEFQAGDSCASLLFEAPDMPWEFLFDTSRHMWDEMRHCEFGETKLRSLGVDFRKAGISNMAYNLRQTLTPLDRYAALTTQEADAFPGKHAGLKDAMENGDSVSSMAWSYDIADETQHVRFGHKWIPVMIEKTREPRSVDQVKQDAENWRAHVLAKAYAVYSNRAHETDPEKIIKNFKGS